MKVLIFATHPIQYQTPIYRGLNNYFDLKVIYLLDKSTKQQAKAGFGVEFDWDIPLLDGYNYQYLKNHSKEPSSSSYNGILLHKKELDQLFKEEQPQIVIINGWFPKGLKQVINYCYKNKIKTLCRGDSTLLMTNNKLKRVLKEIYIRTILRKINAFFYVGKENKEYYLHYGVKENQLYPGLHCINTPFFKEHFNKNPKKEFDVNSIKIGFAGKFIAIKQPLLLIEAIKKSNYKNNIQVQLIGDGPLKNDIINIANQNEVSINFLGFLNQSEIVKKGYSAIDFLVLPSKSETWGLVVNEVMTGGIPTIVSDTVGCNSDLIIDGETGFKFKNGDVNELAQKIDLMITLLTNNNHQLTKNVLNTIEPYSLNNTIASFKGAINRLITES